MGWAPLFLKGDNWVGVRLWPTHWWLKLQKMGWHKVELPED